MKVTPAHLNQILRDGLAERVAPAVAAAVGDTKSPNPTYLFAGGSLKNATTKSCSVHTLFDLASLTKVFSTTLIAAEAFSLGKLCLDETPFSQWPGLSVKHLLSHRSGLPALGNYYARPLDRLRVVKQALATTLESSPGTKTLYSDVGFIVLGSLLEARLKERLDVIFDDLSARHYGSTSMHYKCSSLDNVAPTGHCQHRLRHLHGEVNDLNAFAMNGIAPHAGLFGTIHDVAKAAHFFLRAYHQPSLPIEKILQEFMRAQGERPIGFDRASRNGSTDGALSSLAIGHLGFTGTSFWIDPVKNNYFVLLTNHVEASLKKGYITQLRRDFHRAAARLIQN